MSPRAVVLALAVAAMTQPAFAQPAPEVPLAEQVRQRLLDTCVLEQGRNRGQYVAFADACRCATSRILPTMSEAELREVRKWERVTRALSSRWQEAWAACN